MQIFAVIAPEASPALAEAIEKKYKDRWTEVAPGQYFLAAPKSTTQQVSDNLGLPGGGLGRAMVLHVVNWNGWHARNIWEWLGAQSADNSETGATGV
jgi:hypothetical protein